MRIHTSHTLPNRHARAFWIIARFRSWIRRCERLRAPSREAFESLFAGLAGGGAGLLLAGGLAAPFIAQSKLRGALRQLLLGALIGLGVG